MATTGVNAAIRRVDNGQTLVVDQANGGKVAGGAVVQCIRRRFTIAEVNAGTTLLAAPGAGYAYRVLDAAMIAVGGAASGATTVDILATLAAGSRKLLAAAIAGLTQSALLRAGAANAAILADGASFTANDANTAITVGKTGGALATATHIDVLVWYVVDEVCEAGMFEPFWTVQRSVAPDDAPLSLDEAKAQCTVDDELQHDDPLIEAYCLVAAEVVERAKAIALQPQTWIRTANGFPCDSSEAIVLPRPPLRTVVSIQYRDTAGQLQTWAADQYRVIQFGTFGAIVPAYGVCYPSTSCDPDAVVVTFECGYATVDEIPSRYMLAQRLLVAHWYAHREIDGGEGIGLASLLGEPLRVDPCA